MKKRLLSVLLCLCMVVTLLPTAALAAMPGTITVGGVEVGCGHYLANGAVESQSIAYGERPACDGYVLLTERSGVYTLTLHNANITGAANGSNNYGIYANGDLTIELEGASTVTAGDAADSSCGIYAQAITISGTGSLTAKGGEAEVESCGINSTGGVIISGADTKVVAVGGKANHETEGKSYGIYANGGITYAGGLLVAKGGSAYQKQATNGLTFQDGLVAGTNYVYSGTATGVYYVISPGTTANPAYHVVEGNVTGITTADGLAWSGTDNIDLTLTNTIIIGSDATDDDAYAVSVPYGGKLTLSGYNVVLAGNAAYNSSENIVFSAAVFGVGSSGGSGKLTIDGSGSLVAIGGNASGDTMGFSFGIKNNAVQNDPQPLTISADVTAIGGSASGRISSYASGLYNSVVNVSGGNITAIGGSAGGSYGIHSTSGGEITISGGSGAAIAGSATTAKAVSVEPVISKPQTTVTTGAWDGKAYTWLVPVMEVDLDGTGSGAPVKYADFETGWNATVNAMSTVTNHVTVKLLDNLTADDTTHSFGTGVGFDNGSILVPVDNFINLDLNGMTIDRGLTVKVNNGCVIRVKGVFTLKDTSANAATAPGKITGGYDGAAGGVVINFPGRLTMEGGCITGNNGDSNSSSRYGSGVFVEGGTALTMTGGEISGNTNGAGVYIENGSALFNVSGTAKVTGNFSDENIMTRNVYIPEGTWITVNGTLQDGAAIGVTLQSPPTDYPNQHSWNTVAQNDTSLFQPTPGDAAKFTSDDVAYGIIFISNPSIHFSGACIAKAYTIIYNTDGGTEIPAGSYTHYTDSFTLPVPPTRSGYTFKGWKVTSAATEGTGFELNDTFTGASRELNGAYGDVTLTAQWEENGGGYTYTDPSYPVPVTGGENSISATATLDGHTANISVSTNALEETIRGLDRGSTLTFDAALGKGVASASLNARAAELLRSLGAEMDINAEFRLDSGKFNISLIKLDGLSGQQTGSLEVRLVPNGAKAVDTVDGRLLAKKATSNFDIGVRLGGKELKETGGAVKVELNSGDLENLSKAGVYTVNENGELEYVMTHLNGDVISFYPPHFSPFYLVEFPFEDVPDDAWYHEDAVFTYLSDMLKGTGDTTFAPHDTTTRGMIVTILYRLEGEPTIMFVRAPDKVFSDVADGAWYEKAVQWAQLNGIVDGYGDGRFGPDDPITREQLAAILYRYAQYKDYDVSVGEDTNILSYNDAFDIAEYAIPAMQWVCGAGLINGDSGNLMPQGNAERCQAAAILHRFSENKDK